MYIFEWNVWDILVIKVYIGDIVECIYVYIYKCLIEIL